MPPRSLSDICVHKGCTKYRQGGKLCRAHGSPRRPPCRIEGCSTESATLVRGLCTRHDPRGAICNAPGCTRFKQRRGFCRTHLGSREQCQSKGCIQFVDAHGSCPKHGRFKPKPRACPVCKTRGVRHSDERCHFRRQERQQEEPKQATPPKPPRAEPAPLPETSPAPFTWKLLKKQP